MDSRIDPDITVLVIDDEPISFRLLERIFKEEGWEPVWAKDGVTGIELARSVRPNVILLDLVLPDKNGFEVCGALKEDEATRDIPVIFLTSKTNREDKLKAFEAGAVDFITKPFFTEEVRARVKTQISLKMYADELKEKNKQLSLLAEKLQMLYLTDELMLIGNRRAFEIEIEKTHNNSVRYHNPYCLLIADIDSFKKFNDCLGHQAGDKVLRTLGQIFKNAVRATDFVARYGGEEIVVILPQTDCQGALHTAERIQQELTRQNIIHPDSPIANQLTVSIGISCFDPKNPDFSYYEVIRKADNALYRAKRAGRNVIRVYEE